MKLNRTFAKTAGVFLLFLIGFWILSLWYLSPALDGKVMRQGDMQQVNLMKHAAEQVKSETGDYPAWNDRLFSGMPGNLITGIKQGSLLLKYNVLHLFGLVKSPFQFLFVAMASMFVLLWSVKVDRYMAAAGAIGYAFMTFSISSYEAGHITKVLAMGAMPGVIAGLVLLSQKRWLWGVGILGLFFGMVVNYFHYQIAYYAGIMAGIYILVDAIMRIKQGELKSAVWGAALAALAMAVGTLTCVGKLVDTMQYSQATMRGGSELASEVPQNGPQQNDATGLDIEYAFSWSYGIDESMTLLIPGFKGGSSNELMAGNELGVDRLPLYFGELQFTSGPIYIGAVLMILFVLGFITAFHWKNQSPDSTESQRAMTYAWFALAAFVVSLVLAWGRHFGINEWLFNNLPYYNKFRTPMMALVIAQVVVPFLGFYGVQALLSGKLSDSASKLVLKHTAIASAVIFGLAMMMASGSNFSSMGDSKLAESGGPQVVEIIKELRSKLVWGDIWRSLSFAFIALAMVWGGVKKQIKLTQVGMALIAIVGFDMMGVAKRYLSDENWEQAEVENEILPSKADEQVMAANKDHARVYDLRINPFNDNHAAPWHRNVGGYHPAKLSRYQDLISYGLTPNGGQISSEFLMNNSILDMLNCRYILTRDQSGSGDQVIERGSAFGSAWFVSQVKEVGTAKEAMQTLLSSNLRQVAVVESNEGTKPSTQQWAADSMSSVSLGEYSMEKQSYTSSNSAAGLLVFSELYYIESVGHWEVSIDDQPAKALRVNYMLRAVEVPAGKHSIVWTYVAADRGALYATELASSALIVLLVLGLLYKSATEAEEETA